MEIAPEKSTLFTELSVSRLESNSTNNSSSLPDIRTSNSSSAGPLGNPNLSCKGGSAQNVGTSQSMSSSAFRSLQRSSQSIKDLTESERDGIDEKIICCLLSHDQNLLAAICEGSIVGDAAATLSAEILSLLRQQGREITENFTKRLVSKKMSRFVQKGSDLADVLRDNSMASMCLNSYARYEGLGFLSTCLKSAMAQILPTIGTIELDPNKLPPGTTEADIEENEAKLKTSVVVILRGILDSKLHMPHSIRRLCAFLKTVVLQSVKEQQAQSPNTAAKVSGVPIITQQSPSTHAIASSSNQSISGPSQLQASPGTHHTPSTATLPSISEKHITASDMLVSTKMSNSEANMVSAVVGSNSSSFGQSGTSRSGPSPIESSLPGTHRKSSANGGTPTFASRLTGMLGLSLENVPGHPATAQTVRKRATSVQIDAKNRFSLIEKIVSSFLFLRFFIPAITSPDVYGLLPSDVTALTPSQRRALLICGKIFTGICNDVDFGHKEEHLVTLNEFLRSWRGQIRQYLQWAMQGSGNEPVLAAKPAAPEEFGVSLATPAVPNSSSPKRFKTKDTLQPLGILGTNRHKLFAFLAQHIESLDKSLNDQDFLSRLSPSELDGIKENWIELKSCISKSHYILPNDTRSSNQSISNFWTSRKPKPSQSFSNKH